MQDVAAVDSVVFGSLCLKKPTLKPVKMVSFFMLANFMALLKVVTFHDGCH